MRSGMKLPVREDSREFVMEYKVCLVGVMPAHGTVEELDAVMRAQLLQHGITVTETVAATPVPRTFQ